MNRTIYAPLLLAALAVLGAPAAARAQTATGDCPTEIPSASSTRRALAKEWFSRAEAAEAASDPIGAVKAYQCSLRLVPHAFTAFNLGRLAERTGDLELAVESFNTYLKLSPEAADKTEIESKLAALNERIRSLRTEQLPNPPPGTATGPVEATPPASGGPVPDLRPSPPSESPPGVSSREGDSSSGATITPVMWAVGGVGVAALAGGVFLNVAARSKMDKCRELASQNNKVAADAACDAAKPRAYGSYALFGVAAAAAVTDAVLLILGNRDSGERSVSVAPTAGGAIVGTHFRF
jgi:hypothetical protein